MKKIFVRFLPGIYYFTLLIPLEAQHQALLNRLLKTGPIEQDWNSLEQQFSKYGPQGSGVLKSLSGSS